MKIVEGELRCKELSEYLTKVKAPMKVVLSEDGSGIDPKAEYDASLNEITGPVPPISNSTGMPIPHTFKARSTIEIARHMKKPLSYLVYVVIAQPLKENTPPFVLLMYGTDNKFKAVSVVKRWQFIREKLLE